MNAKRAVLTFLVLICWGESVFAGTNEDAVKEVLAASEEAW